MFNLIIGLIYFLCFIFLILDKLEVVSSCACVDTESCAGSRRCRPELLLFLCNQLSEQDAWWDRLLTDAKSPLMLCGEVK